MNDKDYEMIGESIWDTYRNMASILAEADFLGPGAKKAPLRHRLGLTKRGRRAGKRSEKEADENMTEFENKRAKRISAGGETEKEKAIRLAGAATAAAHYGDG